MYARGRAGGEASSRATTHTPPRAPAVSRVMALQRSIGNSAVTRLIQQSRQEQREESARHIPTVQRAESGPGAYAQVAPAGGIATFTAGNLLVAFVPAGTTGQQLTSYLAVVPAGSVVVLQRPVLDLAAVAVHSGFHAAYPAATGEAEVQHDGFGSPMGWTVTSPAGATHGLPARISRSGISSRSTWPPRRPLRHRSPTRPSRRAGSTTSYWTTPPTSRHGPRRRHLLSRIPGRCQGTGCSPRSRPRTSSRS
jgi:hypothetical protein